MDKIPIEWAPVVAKAWLDEAFKKLLESNPAMAFSQLGLTYNRSEPLTVPPCPQGLVKSNLRAGSRAQEWHYINPCTFSAHSA